MALHISTGPHLRSRQDTPSLMRDVLIALCPAVAASLYFYGWTALWILLVSTACAVLSEFVWQKLMKKPIRLNDCSAAVTGLLIGLNMPATVPVWVPVIGSVFAIIIVKQLFGGIGHNFLNPALAARAVLLTSWPSYMTKALVPARTLTFGLFESGVDAITSATPLVAPVSDIRNLLFGNIAGAIGETCKVAILLGLVYLLIRGVIRWQIPVCMLGTVALMSWILGKDPLTAVLSGGVLFGAVFMATDYVTTPMLKIGQAIFGVGCGILVVLIRNYGNYPEGVTYAILIMNIVTPLLDRSLKRKVYGEVKQNG